MLKNAILILLGAAIGAAAVGAIASQVGGDRNEVRISVQKLDSGAVAVALQEADAEGGWGERVRPELNRLPADAPTGRWFSSSAIEIGEAPGPRHTACLVHHGSNADEFWLAVTRNAFISSRNIGLELTITGSPDRAAQAQMIRDCADQGVGGIATSVPDADALRDAIRYAQDAGVVVLTYNSGRLDAESLGVPIHVSLDEAAVGRRAGEEFNEAGVAGTVLCVLHEPANAGLEERCDALETAYAGGEVERLGISGVADIEESTAQMAERLQQGDIGGLLTLNSALMDPSVAAVATAGSDAKIAAVGVLDAAQQVVAGNVFIALTDQPWFQSDYILASLKNYLGALDLGLTAAGIAISPTTLVAVEPIVLDFEASKDFLDAFNNFLAELAAR